MNIIFIPSSDATKCTIKDYGLAGLHLKTEIKDIMTDLVIIEAQVKVSSKIQEHIHQNKK